MDSAHEVVRPLKVAAAKPNTIKVCVNRVHKLRSGAFSGKSHRAGGGRMGERRRAAWYGLKRPRLQKEPSSPQHVPTRGMDAMGGGGGEQ